MILGVDTSSKIGSVALSDGERVIDEIMSDSPASFSRQLLGMMDGLLSRNNLSLQSLKAVCAATGPGSFTGIRIGLATVEGIALSTRIGITGVSTLEAMAMASKRSGAIIPAVDAGGANVYFARFERANGALTRTDGDAMGTLEEVRRLHGPDAVWNESTELKCSVAGGAALCAAARMKAGMAVAGPLKPNYIQRSAAERMINH